MVGRKASTYLDTPIGSGAVRKRRKRPRTVKPIAMRLALPLPDIS